MSAAIDPYLDELPEWRKVVSGKHLLFDTDAFISITKYNALKILDEFVKLDVTQCYIHPVYSELLCTDHLVERVLRQSLLTKYKFVELPLTSKDFINASTIQSWLALKTTFPSPVDLYLGGKVASLSKDSIYILTSNLKDFLYPLYHRVGGIVLQNDKQCKILSILSLDQEQLDPFK